MKSFSMAGDARRLTSWASLLVFFLLLIVPFTAQLMGLGGSGSSAENRMLAPAPDWPDSWAGWFALPRKMDAWLRDHFGCRVALVRANSRLRYALFHVAPTRQVLFGRGNRLFLSGPDESHPYSII